MARRPRELRIPRDQRSSQFLGQGDVCGIVCREVCLELPNPLAVAFDFVAVGQGGREPGGDLGHRAKMDRLPGFGEVLSTPRI